MSTLQSSLAAFVLAGGKSTRMGADKAFVMLNGRSLLARMLDLARSVTANVTIVGNVAKFASFAPVVEDVFPGCGPLAAIHAALASSKAELNLILAVDVPFVSPAFLEFLSARARASSATVTVPRTVEGWQPLCAIYRPDFAEAAARALRTGRYKIDQLFAEVETLEIGEEELESAGFSPKMFRNLNTPEDLIAAHGA